VRKRLIATHSREGVADKALKRPPDGQKWPDRYAVFSPDHRTAWSVLATGDVPIGRVGYNAKRAGLPWVRTLAAQGIAGALAGLLNGARAGEPVGVPPGTHRAGLLPHSQLPQTLQAQQLLKSFSRGGWLGLTRALLFSPQICPVAGVGRRPWRLLTRLLVDAEYAATWHLALAESAMFSAAGFDVSWCAHGQHFYVRSDKRQVDCPLHSKAGEVWRWRRKKRGQHRRKGVQRNPDRVCQDLSGP
jgi:hypothetical protein